ncbi:hypothetical protein GETHLI_02020 [Geothrix limicola]|uniref:Uncharacterized protein n=1 Tax=Geothrix limicola TaxID=2927978 RepID=A0ABQ5QB71_9BACT|nr:hypothetical protein [Geothrix limicola]GLH71700.1 hypothetical protein GETHLI_02020 [Geothrix limicola]
MSLLPVKILGLLASLTLAAQGPAAPDRWKLDAAERRVSWDVAADQRLPHSDRIEMAGRRVAGIVSYGADAERNLLLERTCVWPTLRVAPNDTHASLMVRFRRDQAPLWLNGRNQALPVSGVTRFEPRVHVEGPVPPRERLVRAAHQNGILRLETDLNGGLSLVREIFPSGEGTALLERWTLCNPGKEPRVAGVESLHVVTSLPFSFVDKGLQMAGQPAPAPITREGSYRISIDCEGIPDRPIRPGESVSVGLAFRAQRADEPVLPVAFDREREARIALVQGLRDALRLECPDPVLESLFDYSKLRACESIVETKHGPLHAPGGGSYYAAIWANDTIEYVAPFYPFTGYAYGNAASLNAISHFARYMNPGFQPIPSSIVAEGTDFWNGAGDRGDQAMFAFGVSRFLLALGDRAEAKTHWPLVKWSLEYCERKKTKDGVIASDADELEHRFSSGTVNLNTNMLTYGGLRSAADLAHELGEEDLAATYRKRSEALREAMERYFGAEVRGFHTYRYHDGLDELRAWICIPLTMGIDTRKQGTIEALFSPRLWTPDGLLTAEGSTTFWDRSTLYALRGIFYANEPDRALPAFRALSRRRLLGDHVPYVVEAYPEGNGRHLSAESALYVRVVTEGLFGITPRGFRSFELKPSLPASWDHMALRNVRAFGSAFDLEVRRAAKDRLSVRVMQKGRAILDQTLPAGESLQVKLP